MTVLTPGWSFPVGEATSVREQLVDCILPNKGLLKWRRFTIERLRLSQAAALLVLQGMPLGQLFHQCYFASPNPESGPSFTFLAGKLTPLYQPPLALEKITLGRVSECSPDVVWEEVLAAMLRDTLLP